MRILTVINFSDKLLWQKADINIPIVSVVEDFAVGISVVVLVVFSVAVVDFSVVGFCVVAVVSVDAIVDFSVVEAVVVVGSVFDVTPVGATELVGGSVFTVTPVPGKYNIY